MKAGSAVLALMVAGVAVTSDAHQSTAGISPQALTLRDVLPLTRVQFYTAPSQRLATIEHLDKTAKKDDYRYARWTFELDVIDPESQVCVTRRNQAARCFTVSDLANIRRQ